MRGSGMRKPRMKYRIDGNVRKTVLPYRMEVLIERGFMTQHECDKWLKMIKSVDNEMQNLAQIQIMSVWEKHDSAEENK